MAETALQQPLPKREKDLADWFDEISVRFIINLPEHDLTQPARLGFSIEEAHWFYEDFIRPVSALQSPNQQPLPSLNLKRFITLLFAHCPLLSNWATQAEDFYESFIEYKGRVPVRGLILLDESMEKVLLVKGFKKGAKWSFPRGKIARDEDDLTCAVREVYEETGYDAREAGLVPEEEVGDVKSFEHSVRDQDLKLFAIRGVPLETHFAPRTRKEISKIQWWNLADLPTMKRARQFEQQQHALQQDPQTGAIVSGMPAIEPETKPSNFYMVAPFIGPLRRWIKQERRKDRAKERAKFPRQIIIEDEETETAGEDIMPEPEPTDTEENDDIQRLLARLQASKVASTSSTLPEVSTAPKQPPPADAAEALKGLLGVTSPASYAPQPVELQPEMSQMNPLLAMLRGGPNQPPTHPPHTPLEHIQTSPPKATTPHRRHPHPPDNISSFAPPPPFSFPASHLQNPQPARPQPHTDFSFSDGRFAPIPSAQDTVASYDPAPPLFKEPHPLQQTRQVPIQSQLTQFPDLHAPAIPEANRLPLPKLTSHSLALLNAFKSPNQHPARSLEAPVQPNIGRPLESLTSPEKISPESLIGSGGAHRDAPPVPQESKPKARTEQQNALLDLFHQKTAPSAVAAISQAHPLPDVHRLVPAAEPVELSAHPSSSHLHRHMHRQKPPFQRQTSGASSPHPPVQPSLVLDTQGLRPRSPGLTSATVSGPLNAPDFDAVRRNQKVSPVELGQGSGPSSAVERPHGAKWHPTETPQRPGSASRRHVRVPSKGSENESDNVALGPRHGLALSPRASPRPRGQRGSGHRPGSSGKCAQHEKDKDRPLQYQPGQISILKRPSPATHAEVPLGPSVTQQHQQFARSSHQHPHQSTPTQEASPTSQTAQNPPADTDKQKSLLLSLFGTSSSQVEGRNATTQLPPQPRLTPTADSSLGLGGAISPVSPLPVVQGHPQTQPSRFGSLVSALSDSRKPSLNEALMASECRDRSRISSIGGLHATQALPGPGATTVDPLDLGFNEPIVAEPAAMRSVDSGRNSAEKEKTSPMTPTDKDFLLNYLHGVVAGGSATGSASGVGFGGLSSAAGGSHL